MERKLDFFNASSLLERLSEQEALRLKGGDSDVAWHNDLDEVEITDPGSDGDNWTEPGDDWDSHEPVDDYDPTQEGWWDNDDDGGGGSTGGSDTINVPNNGTDPWVRDASGNIIATKTGVTSNLPHGDVTLIFDEVKIKMANGTEVIAYQTNLVHDNTTGELRPPTEAEKSNCFGLAFADGDYWFWDNTLTQGVDEFTGFLNMLDSFYQESSKSEATMAIIYNDAGNGPIHAGIINPDGSFTAKGGVSEPNTYYSEADFRAPEGEYGPQYPGTITYYSLKN